MDHFELVSEYSPTGTTSRRRLKKAGGGLQGRKSVPDITGCNGLWQDVYDGKCDSEAE